MCPRDVVSVRCGASRLGVAIVGPRDVTVASVNGAETVIALRHSAPERGKPSFREE